MSPKKIGLPLYCCYCWLRFARVTVPYSQLCVFMGSKGRKSSLEMLLLLLSNLSFANHSHLLLQVQMQLSTISGWGRYHRSNVDDLVEWIRGLARWLWKWREKREKKQEGKLKLISSNLYITVSKVYGIQEQLLQAPRINLECCMGVHSYILVYICVNHKKQKQKSKKKKKKTHAWQGVFFFVAEHAFRIMGLKMLTFKKKGVFFFFFF